MRLGRRRSISTPRYFGVGAGLHRSPSAFVFLFRNIRCLPSKVRHRSRRRYASSWSSLHLRSGRSGHVAGRADHPARHRQRYLADDLRQHHLPASERPAEAVHHECGLLGSSWRSVAVAVIACVIYITEGQRRIPIQYAKRVVGRKVYGGQSTYLPLRINMAGRHPGDLRVVRYCCSRSPRQMTPWGWAASVAKAIGPATWWYLGRGSALDHRLHVLLHGGAVQPHRPGRQLEEVRRVHPRHSSRPAHGCLPGPGAHAHHSAGALFLAAIVLLPTALIRGAGVPFYFGGTSLLIVVGCCARHDETDGSSTSHASLRGLPQVVP